MRQNATNWEAGKLVMPKELLNDEIAQVTREPISLRGSKSDVNAMEAFRNCRATIVDDDQLVCETLTETLRSWGLSAEGFTQPEAALEDIRENKSDIVLLDVFISDVCGLDLIPQLGGDLKIIVTTGYADKDTAIRALRLGAFDLLEKPCQNELLRHSILRALSALANERESKRLIDDLKQSRSELLMHQQRLGNMNAQLLDTNRALSILAQNVERERDEIEKRIALRLRNLIVPMVVKLRNDQVLHKYRAQLDMLTRQIEDLTSGFAIDSRVAMSLSFTELKIASLIKNGITTEEIARQLYIASSTVRTHRKNIRRKLKINNATYSLRNFLSSRA
ncbi:MAG: response regulator [Syntrophobacteraceae bacterium]